MDNIKTYAKNKNISSYRGTFKNIILFFQTVLLVLCSGSEYFRIENSRPTNLALLFTSVILLLVNRKAYKKSLYFSGVILILILINFIICYQHPTSNDLFILLITVFAIFVLTSSASLEQFMLYYVAIMSFEALLSLVCFLICIFGKATILPGYQEYFVQGIGNAYNIRYLTPYYTIGWLSTNGFFNRNAGLFWEPGAHAIYLIFGLFFAYNSKSYFRKKRHFILLLTILFVTLLTTLSTSGYIELIILIILISCSTNYSKKKILNNFLIIVLIFLLLLALAIQLGVFDKIILKSGSYNTRLNDTVYGLKIALDRPLFGYGIFESISRSKAYSQYRITAMSNGIISMLISMGIPCTLLYFIQMFLQAKRNFDFSSFKSFIFLVMCLVMFFSESIFLYPILLTFLYPWRKQNSNVNK